MKKPKHRDFHKLKIIRGEALGATTFVPSLKTYKRHSKHKSRTHG